MSAWEGGTLAAISGVGTATIEGTAGTNGSTASGGRAAGLASGRVLSASVIRPSSATTAANPIRTKPPANPVVPARTSVVPRVNSLIGIPNPIAATPAAASTIPNNDKITDIYASPSANRLPRQSHGAMVTKEFDPVPVRPQ